MAISRNSKNTVDKINGHLESLKGKNVTELFSEDAVQKVENPTPIDTPTMLHQFVELFTIDNTDPQNTIQLYETYRVTPSNFSTIKLEESGGVKHFLQFSKSKYGIKFHMPYGSNKNKIYLTFCEKDKTYQDGIKDYTEKVTQEWTEAAITYFNRLPDNTVSGSSQKKTFSTEEFPAHKTIVLRANFKGTGASSSVETDGVVNFTFKYLDKPAIKEAGTTTATFNSSLTS